jgi:Zinc knuckle
VQLWVQIHNAPLQQMTKKAIKQVAQEVGDLVDLHLEGADKWDTFSRIRLDINSDKDLKDRLDICLPYGKERTTLIHYERLVRVCLYCAKIGHEVEHCDERIRLLSRIKHYPPELHEVLNEKLRPRCGGWIGKIYLLNRLK